MFSSQGNNPRANQLQRQSERNEALMRNYSKELEDKRFDLQSEPHSGNIMHVLIANVYRRVDSVKTYPTALRVRPKQRRQVHNRKTCHCC